MALGRKETVLGFLLPFQSRRVRMRFLLSVFVLQSVALCAACATLWRVYGREVDELRVGNLLLVDDDGTVRASLGITPGDSAMLTLCDENGVARISMSADTIGRPSISVCDRNGAICGILGTREDDTEDESDWSPLLFFQDPDGSIVWSAP